MSKKEKKLLWRILAAGVIFAVGLPLHYRESFYQWTGAAFFQSSILSYIEFPLFLTSYLIIGHDILWKAIRNIKKGQVFDENFLMSIATIGAFFLAEYAEGVAVMLFYQVGELFQSYAVSRSRRSIAELMDIRPDYANVMRDGSLIQVDPEEVAIGDIIVVKPGERIPLDGVVEDGHSALDTSALTGESVPRDTTVGDNVISGCINQTGRLTIRVSKVFGESTVSKILELVENASDKKSKSENFITRFARYYTPFVVFAALAVAILPPLVTGQPFGMWIERALTFLVVSCPCALVISVPLSFFGGIGGSSKCGVLVKGSNYLELLASTEMVVFDKTGTLTKGNFEVSEIRSNLMSRDELLRLAAQAEDYSSHPIAVSIKKAYGRPVDTSVISDIEEIAGHGVKALIDGREVLAGNTKLMDLKGIIYQNTKAAGTVAFVGDGINDAPVLARADIGIAMGGLGSDAAIEAADVVIMTDEPSKIATVMKIARKTLRIVRQNIVFALAVKGFVLVLTVFGFASMWGAVFADVGVSVLAILNAIRALNVKKFNQAPGKFISNQL